MEPLVRNFIHHDFSTLMKRQWDQTSCLMKKAYQWMVGQVTSEDLNIGARIGTVKLEMLTFSGHGMSAWQESMTPASHLLKRIF